MTVGTATGMLWLQTFLRWRPVQPTGRTTVFGACAVTVDSLRAERQRRLVSSRSVAANWAVPPAFLALPAGAGPLGALVLASLLWGTADVQDVRVGGRCFGALTGFLVSGRKP
jgi:hypothetical protein